MKVKTNVRAGRMSVTTTGGGAGARVKGTCTGTVVV